MGSAFAWAADKVLTVLFGAKEEIPDYPSTVPCPCDCGMTMGEVKELP